MTPVLVRSLKLSTLVSTASNWIGVQTGSRVRFRYSTQTCEPVVSKTSEAGIVYGCQLPGDIQSGLAYVREQ